MTANPRQRVQVIVSFLLVYIFWGSTYLAIGITADEGMPASVMCALRFLIAGPLMLLACRALGRKIWVSKDEAWRLALIGCLLLLGGNGGLAWAEKYLATGYAALLVSITPIWFLLLETVVFRGDRLSRRGTLGLMLGIAGVAILFWPKFAERQTLGIMQLLAATTLLFSSMSWAIGSVFSRKWQMKVDPFTATGWEMTFAGLGHVMVASVIGDFHHVVVTRRALLATFYLVVFGSWVGYSAYIWLLKHVPTPKVATYAYINPIVAVFLGWLVLNEHLDRYILWGSVVILAGVALVTTATVHNPQPDGGHTGPPELESEV